MSLVLVCFGLLVLGAVAPLAARLAGRNAGYLLSAGFALATGVLVASGPAVIAGGPVTATVPWAPSAGLDLSLRMDALSLLFAAIVTGIGALVMAYSARYLSPGRHHGRLYATLTVFATAMLGLVLADNVLALFVFWELTSITSFFLIGGKGEGSKGATRAFLTTGLGGLALLAGLLLLTVATGETRLSAILAEPEVVRASPLALPIMVLVLLGAFTKSAQLPFHFWLPGAMVAPTPVSTYLHAATMVKAGIYLLLRMSPLYAGTAPWTFTLITFGLATAVWGAVVALKQFDLKALLAYSTVSQLGFLTALIGVGTPLAIAAASLHTLAHALYKATLFMIVGVIDNEAGSRDIRQLSGLRRVMPVTATVTGLAALSMAGIPPLVGFVSKEEAFAAFLAPAGAAWLGPLAAALAVTASIATFAYGTRIFDGAFGGPVRQPLWEPGRAFVAPAMLTAGAGLVLGLAVPLLDPLVNQISDDVLGAPADVHLALWHGFTPALGLSVLVIVGGLALFRARNRVARVLAPQRVPVSGADAFDRAYTGVLSLGARVGSPAASNAPALHVAPLLAAVAAVGVAGWLRTSPAGTTPPVSPVSDWLVVALLAIAVTGVALATSRLAAVALLGVAGFVIAVWYVLLGAPDLALTQLLVETLTIAVVVLVFRRLPRAFTVVPAVRRGVAAATAVAGGVLATAGTYALTGRRDLSEAGAYFLEAAEAEAGGSNAVNTILVDFRALDTLGEITVLAAAAIGIVTLVRLAPRRTP